MMSCSVLKNNWIEEYVHRHTANRFLLFLDLFDRFCCCILRVKGYLLSYKISLCRV